MLSQAANGKTYDALQTGLHISGDKSAVANQFFEYNQQLKNSSGELILSIANEIYVQQGYQLNETFQKVALQEFESGVESLNFANAVEKAEIINKFVENVTNDKIHDLVSPDSIGSDTRVILVNAVYFKGNRTYWFDTEDTFQGIFYVSEIETTPVQFMTIEKNFNYVVLGDLNATAVELKYASSKFSFVVVLPNERTGWAWL